MTPASKKDLLRFSRQTSGPRIRCPPVNPTAEAKARGKDFPYESTRAPRAANPGPHQIHRSGDSGPSA